MPSTLALQKITLKEIPGHTHLLGIVGYAKGITKLARVSSAIH